MRTPTAADDGSNVATSAPQPPPNIATTGKPHAWTIGLALTAAIISAGSLFVSTRSYVVSREGVETAKRAAAMSESALKVGQRAYLAVQNSRAEMTYETHPVTPLPPFIHRGFPPSALPAVPREPWSPYLGVRTLATFRVNFEVHNSGRTPGTVDYFDIEMDLKHGWEPSDGQRLAVPEPPAADYPAVFTFRRFVRLQAHPGVPLRVEDSVAIAIDSHAAAELGSKEGLIWLTAVLKCDYRDEFGDAHELRWLVSANQRGEVAGHTIDRPSAHIR